MELRKIIINQDIDTLKKIINRGRNLSNIRLLAILDIVENPNLEFLQLLIDNGVDINSEGSKEDTNFMFSIIKKSLKKNKELWFDFQEDTDQCISLISDFLKKDDFQYDFKNYAYMHSFLIYKFIILHLFDEIEEIKISLEKLKYKYIEGEIFYKYSTLMSAIGKNDIELVKFLLKNKADVNLYDFFQGNTPLHYALNKKKINIKLIKLLIESGADVNKKNFEGLSPLDLAIANIKIVEFLVEQGASLYEYCNLRLPLIESEKFGKYMTFYEISKEISFEIPDYPTILMKSIESGNIPIIKILIEKGATLNTKNSVGDTALIMASAKGFYDVVKLLVEKGASIEIKNDNGINAIDVANKQIKELLLLHIESSYKNSYKSKKIKKITKDNYNNHLFKIPEDYFTSKYIFEYGTMDINEQNEVGKTKLISFCEEGNIESISDYLKFGADINIQDHQGYTALEYASFSDNFREIRKLFIPYLDTINLPHQPQKAVNILTNFTIDTPIKYSTHLWDFGDVKKEYGSFQGFMEAIKTQWQSIEQELRELSPKLHEKIYNFLINDKNNKSWCSQVDINIGWSSLEGLDKWCNEGNNPFDFKLDEEYEINGKSIGTFGEVISLFKQEIEIRNENNVLEEIFLEQKKKLGRGFKVELKKLKGKSFYTDVEIFKNSINRIFNEIKKRPQNSEIEVEGISKDSKIIEIKIIQLNSQTGRDSKDMLDEVNNGDFKILKESFKNLCDWSIESSYEDNHYRINYLKDLTTQEIEAVEEAPQGFRHILRFYR